MKTKLTVTTVVEITGVKTSYEIWEALTKSFKNVAYVDRTQDNQGYSFTFKENPSVDLKAFGSKVKKIIEEAHAKELASDAKSEALAKKTMEGFTGSVLTPVTNKYAEMMSGVILSMDKDILRHIGEKDFSQAKCTWNDQQDLITLRTLLDTKDSVECHKYARRLDTYVREGIPDKVYNYLVEGEI